MAGNLQYVDLGIVVKDVARSVDWYKKMLGLKIEMAMPDAKQPRFARLTNGAIAIMLSDGANLGAPRPRVPAATAKAVASRQAPRVLTFYLRMDDGVDALYRSVRRKGAKIAQPLTDQPYGMRDFTMTDPDGFRIGVGQPLPRPVPPA